MEKRSPAIGIHLGTTYSSVGVWSKTHNRIEIIFNDQGSKITPSYVGFTDTHRLIGDAAKAQVAKNPINTIFGAKRLIGRSFNDPIVQKDIKLLPFKMETGTDGNILISVRSEEEVKKFRTEQISSFMLTKMKEIAESYLSQPVSDAVITVPAYFNEAQRKATKDAGTMAGLNVLRLLNESSAAALVYGANLGDSEKARNICIFHLGGGSFEVSFLTIERGIIEVKSTAGDSHLGGEDFDLKLLEYCVDDFKNKTGIDIQINRRAMRRLKTQCEKAKMLLSLISRTEVQVDSLYEAEDYYCTLTRTQFEDLCLPLFKRTIALVEQAFKDADIQKHEIDVVLVGGSSRIPKVIQLVTEFFGKKPDTSLAHDDETLASGAAIQAALLTGQHFNDLLLLEATSFSLGIESSGGRMVIVIPRNTTLPTKKEVVINHENQPAVLIKVFEGEETYAKDNTLRGEITLDLEPVPKEVTLQVTFSCEPDGCLTVTVKDIESGKSKAFIC